MVVLAASLLTGCAVVDAVADSGTDAHVVSHLPPGVTHEVGVRVEDATGAVAFERWYATDEGGVNGAGLGEEPIEPGAHTVIVNVAPGGAACQAGFFVAEGEVAELHISEPAVGQCAVEPAIAVRA